MKNFEKIEKFLTSINESIDKVSMFATGTTHVFEKIEEQISDLRIKAKQGLLKDFVSTETVKNHVARVEFNKDNSAETLVRILDTHFRQFVEVSAIKLSEYEYLMKLKFCRNCSHQSYGVYKITGKKTARMFSVSNHPKQFPSDMVKVGQFSRIALSKMCLGEFDKYSFIESLDFANIPPDRVIISDNTLLEISKPKEWKRERMFSPIIFIKDMKDIFGDQFDWSYDLEKRHIIATDSNGTVIGIEYSLGNKAQILTEVKYIHNPKRVEGNQISEMFRGYMRLFLELEKTPEELPRGMKLPSTKGS